MFLLGTLLLFTEDTLPDTSAEATADYTGRGLQEIPKSGVQPLLLEALWLVLEGPVAYQRFGRHAATLCMQWVIDFQVIEAEYIKISRQVLDLGPYFQVCGEWLFTST